MADGERFGRGKFRGERGRLLSGQNRETVNGFLNPGFERRNCRESQIEQRAAARDIEVGAASAIEERLGDVESLGLHVGILARDGELVLQPAQLEIVSRDFGRDAHEHVEPRGFDRGELCVGGLNGSPDAAEQIEFPGGVKAGVVEFKFARVAWCAGRRGGFAEQTVLISRIGLDGGRKVERGEPAQSARLP